MNKIVYTQKFTKRIGQIGQKPFHIQKNFYNVLLLKFENLKIFPKMYPKIKNQYRKIPIQNYIILYKIKREAIYIVNIIPTKSNYYNKIHRWRYSSNQYNKMIKYIK